jgi:hypothetical protein
LHGRRLGGDKDVAINIDSIICRDGSICEDVEKEALRVIWKDILDLKSDEEMFPELVSNFFGKVPIETGSEYAEEIKRYVEDLMQNNVENPYLPRLYVYLNKSEIETLDYLIHNANKFSSQKFNDFLSNTRVDFSQFGHELFLEKESKLWIKLGEAERQKEEYPNLFENIKTLVNKFINVTI